MSTHTYRLKCQNNAPIITNNNYCTNDNKKVDKLYTAYGVSEDVNSNIL